MADKPGGGGGEKKFGAKPRVSGGSSPGSGFAGFVMFMLLVGGLVYAAYLQFSDSTTSGGPPLLGNSILQRMFPGLSSTSTSSVPLDIPAGFTASDLSPFFREARIAGFEKDDRARMLRIRIPRGASILGWTVRGTLGSQLIGGEGAVENGDVRVPLRDSVLMPEHDRVLLLDALGKLADYYSF